MIKRAIILSVLLALGQISFAQHYTVEINGSGFESSEGQAMIRIFNQEDGFPREGKKAYKVLKVAISNKTCQAKVDLPKGDYAFIIIHDENKNDDIDKNWLGMPSEALGVSNYPKLSKPDFKKAKQLINSNVKINIKVDSIL